MKKILYTLLLALFIVGCNRSPEPKAQGMYLCATPIGVAQITTERAGFKAIHGINMITLKDETAGKEIFTPFVNCTLIMDLQ